MRIATERRAGWAMAPQRLEGFARQVRVNSEWLDVVRLGSGDPIVVIPGLAGGWRLVAPLVERLAKRFEVIVCGHRGDRFPASGPWAREVADHAADVAEIIDSLGLERPAVLGVSFGGAVALELAIEHTHRVGALIVQGAADRFKTTLGSKIARRVLERFPLPEDSPFVNQFFNLLHGGKPEPGQLVDFVVERIWETDQSVMARRLALLETFDVSERLWQIDIPALILAGSRDVIVPSSRQKALSEGIADCRFVELEGAGHIAFLTHRSEIAGLVSKMVRRVNHSVC